MNSLIYALFSAMVKSRFLLLVMVGLIISACNPQGDHYAYNGSYYQVQGQRLVVKCDVLPFLLGLPEGITYDAIDHFYNKKVAASDDLGSFKIDSVYYFKNKGVEYTIFKSNEKSGDENIFTKAKIITPYSLKNGIKIGDNINALKKLIPKYTLDNKKELIEYPARDLSIYRDIVFEQKSGLQAHTYTNINGVLSKFVIALK